MFQQLPKVSGTQANKEKMKNFSILFFLLIFLSCSQNSEWISLFDGKNVNGLRGYKMENFPWDSWVIKNGNLKTIPGKHGVDLISEGIFEDFELELEWKLQSGGNSGIFYFASEEETTFGSLHLKCRFLII